jgi:hypothetical protein
MCREVRWTNTLSGSRLVVALVLELANDEGGAVEGRVLKEVQSVLLVAAYEDWEVIEAIVYLKEFVRPRWEVRCSAGRDNQESILREKLPFFNFAG